MDDRKDKFTADDDEVLAIAKAMRGEDEENSDSSLQADPPEPPMIKPRDP